LALNAGYRFDNGQKAVDDPDTLRRGDRVALGVSQYDAIPIALGVIIPVSPFSFFAEASADLLLGVEEFATSPLRAAVGGRYAVSDVLGLEASGVVAASKRPALGPKSELVPIEPRVLVTLGLRVLLGAPARASAKPVPPPAPLPVAPVAPVAPAVPAPLARVNVDGSVLNESGKPLAEVKVVLRNGETEKEATTDEAGRYQFLDFPVGKTQRVIQTADYAPVEETLELNAGNASLPAVALKLEVRGAQIRGLVQGFDGKPVSSTLQVKALGISVETDAAGRFALDVVPGSYVVEIAAPGFVTQSRSVVVGPRAVVIVNADLRRAQ